MSEIGFEIECINWENLCHNKILITDFYEVRVIISLII